MKMFCLILLGGVIATVTKCVIAGDFNCDIDGSDAVSLMVQKFILYAVMSCFFVKDNLPTLLKPLTKRVVLTMCSLQQPVMLRNLLLSILILTFQIICQLCVK